LLCFFLYMDPKGIQKSLWKGESSEDIVDYSQAENIIESYIEPAMFGVSLADCLSILKDLLERSSRRPEPRSEGNDLMEICCIAG
ncbi:MAG: hypothetical protein OXD44_07625, partial [Gammaproteobacteria bacterium]|nr:hypothetical protein [Gammaproteobacteria bacterium]